MNIKWLGLAAVVITSACASSPPPQSPATTPAEPAATKEEAAPPAELSMFDLQLKSLRGYVQAFNRHDAKAIAALYAKEAVFIERGEQTSSGAAAIEANYRDHFAAFPDSAASITRSWHWADGVIFEYVEGGTNTGTHKSHAPTGKKVGFIGASVLRFKPDGRVKSDTTYYDELTMEVQAGWAAGPLAKLEVRPVVAVPEASDSWEVHQVAGKDVGQSKLVAARKSIYTNFSMGSETDFLGALSEDVMIFAFDDPKDAKGKNEAGLLFKEWKKMFADGVVNANATEGWSVDGHVLLLGTYSGKHVGAWGPLKATNKTFKSTFLDIARLDKNDKIERIWSYANNYEALGYLGYHKD